MTGSTDPTNPAGKEGTGVTSFATLYRSIHESFGYPLTERSATSAKVLAATEQRLGLSIPNALREYYLVAGRERRFGTCHNRLLAPQDLFVDKQRLVFMEENQSVVLWGVSIRKPDAEDPPVFQAVDEEPLAWVREHPKCSAFLATMLHYQAVSDGFRFCAGASALPDTMLRLRRGWTYFGEVGGTKAFGRRRQVVCVTPPSEMPFMKGVRFVMAGAKTKAELGEIGNDLGLVLV